MEIKALKDELENISGRMSLFIDESTACINNSQYCCNSVVDRRVFE